MTPYKFDVALTFAGEDRSYVSHIADTLKEHGVRVFYDQFAQATLWGEDLVVYLDEVYRKKSRYVVLFSSVSYVTKIWTSHERRSAQARAIEERGGAYLLPVRLDDTEIPGLPPTIGYLDGRVVEPSQVASFLLEKLGVAASATSSISKNDFMGVPLTAEETQVVTTQRPDGWEYLLMAGGIWQNIRAHEQKALDHELQYAASNGVHVDETAISDFIASRLDILRRNISQVMTVINSEAQVWALGADGEPGDPVRIAHLCNRFGAVYEGILDWSSEIRGTACPEDYRNLLSLLARFSSQAIRAIQEMASRLVAEADRIPAHLANDDPDKGLLGITIHLDIEIDDEVVDQFAAERKRLGV